MDILNFFKKKHDYKKIKLRFEKISLKKDRLKKAKAYLNQLCHDSTERCIQYKKIFFSVYKDLEVKEAIEVGEEIVDYSFDPSFAKVLAVRHKRVGNTKRANELFIIINGDTTEDKASLNEISYLLKNYKTSEDIEKRIEDICTANPNEIMKVYKLSFSTLKDEYVELAVKYGKKYFYNNPEDVKFTNILLNRIKRLELLDDAEEIHQYQKLNMYLNKIKENKIYKKRKFHKNILSKELKVVSEKLPLPLMEKYIVYILEIFKDNHLEIYKLIFSVLKDMYPSLALEYGKLYIEAAPKDSSFLKIWKTREKRYLNKLKEIKNQTHEKEYIAKLRKSRLFNTKKLSIHTYDTKLKTLAARLSTDVLRQIVDSFLLKFTEQESKILEISFSVLKDEHLELSIGYGKRYIEKNPEKYKFAKVLIKRMERLSLNKERLEIAYLVLNEYEDDTLRYIVTKHEIEHEMGVLSVLYREGRKQKVYANIKKLELRFSKHKDLLYREISKLYSKTNYKLAEKYALKSLDIKYNEYVIRELYDLHMVNGFISKALSVLPDNNKLPLLDIKRSNGASLLDLYNNGFDLPVKKIENYKPIEKKVFYILHNRLPYNSGGYATRSHGLLTGVSKFGWKMNGVSRLGYPKDKMPNMVSVSMDTIDTINYHRLLKENIGLGKLPLKEYLEAYARELLEIALVEKPSIIHAASNYMNGVVGNYVAKCLGIPCVYEVRGLWEITRISRQPKWKNTEYYKLMVKMETEAAIGADSVFTLTEALRDEMVSRGANIDKIHLLPNGVVSERFTPLERNKELEKKLNYENKTVVGFIGSFAQYEGIEYIIDSIELLVKKGRKDIVGLMVGDGAVWESMTKRVKEKNLEEYFVFTGRIPHDEVEKYYSLVDIAPLPRKGLPVCEMVSPLKPFEAMAMEKVVLSSNVAALAEIIKDGYNGMLFKKDNVNDLAEKIELLADDTTLRDKLGKQAREWVIQERDWNIISKRLHDVYREL